MVLLRCRKRKEPVNMTRKKIGGVAAWLLAGAFALAATGVSLGAGLWGNLPPAGGSQYPTTLPLTGNETIPADTNLANGLAPQSEIISVNSLRASDRASAGSAWRNALIGGDFGTNLWQRGTSVGSITTTASYTADRWIAWSGTSTTMSVAQDSTAAEKPGTFTLAAKVARTGAGVVQTCFAQEVESANAQRFAGQTAELDFSAYSGAGFSAASGLLQVYILYGTGTDEGTSKMAWSLNGGGGGSSGWTGAANAINSAAIGGANPTTATVAIGTSTLGRYVAVASIPSTATELGVALCWKPVGGSPSNDYVAFSGIQLSVNNNLSAYAGTVQSTASGIAASSFEHRSQEVETGLQQRYYYEIDESASIFPVGPCSAVDTSHTNCWVATPVSMRIAPTLSFANGFATPTSTTQATLGACTTLSAAATVASTVASSAGFLVNCAATTTPAAGVASFLYSNGGSGKIKASAEL